MNILDDVLSVKRIDHKTWQDADCHAVTNIFTFFQQVGNLDLSQVVNLLFENKEICQNDSLQCLNLVTSSELDLLESIINNYIQTGLIMHDPKSMLGTCYTQSIDSFIQAHQVLIYLISLCAIRLHHLLQRDESYNRYINTLMKPEVVATTVARKQKDYGPSNVSKFGMYGLVIRAHDKVGRLKNLLSKKSRTSVQDETVFDTLVDLVGYCVISILWINNWFTIPMSEDYDWSEIKTKTFSYI